MATYKQISFIESLMRNREIGDLADSLEAQTVRAGMGENLSTRQASEFIEALQNCPAKDFALIAANSRPAFKKADMTIGTRVESTNGEWRGTVVEKVSNKRWLIKLDGPDAYGHTEQTAAADSVRNI